MQALVALHAFWLVALALPVILAARWGTPLFLKTAGVGLGITALASLGYLLYTDVFCWWQAFTGLQRYWPQRVLFVLFTEADFPRIHLLVASGVFLASALWEKLRHRERQVGADLTHHDEHAAVPIQRDPDPS